MIDLLLYRMQRGEEQFSSDVRLLAKKYNKLFDKFNVKLIYQFCQFDATKAFKVLAIMEDMDNPHLIIKKLIQKPELSDHILNQLSQSYHNKYGHQEPNQLQHQHQQVDHNQVQENKFNFFGQVPQDVSLSIMYYLDPLSLCGLCASNSNFWKLGQLDSMKQYFKGLCMVLFHHDMPTLPSLSRFEKVREYVLSHPIEFGPNSRNAVINNLTYYVWKSQPKSFKLQKNYYLSFGSYRNLFFQCPRPHFNGFYLCKHKYLRMGQKTYKNSFAPIHVIFHYRYIRFVNDGSILYYVTPRKLKSADIQEKLSLKNLTENNEESTMVGQYMQYKDKLYIKSLKSNTIFSYEFQIQANEGKVGHHLSVVNYTLEMIDEKEILQTLYEAKPHRQPLIFEYNRDKSIWAENAPEIRACSL